MAAPLPPLGEAADQDDWAIPAAAPEPLKSQAAFPEMELGDPPPVVPAVSAPAEHTAAREPCFPLLGATDRSEHAARSPSLLPSVGGGDPPSGLFVLDAAGGWRGAVALRGAQLSIRVDPVAGLAAHQPMIAVLQLPNNSYVQLYTWVESVAPDATVLIGAPDPGGLAELRQLLEWRRAGRRSRERRPKGPRSAQL